MEQRLGELRRLRADASDRNNPERQRLSEALHLAKDIYAEFCRLIAEEQDNADTSYRVELARRAPGGIAVA